MVLKTTRTVLIAVIISVSVANAATWTTDYLSLLDILNVDPHRCDINVNTYDFKHSNTPTIRTSRPPWAADTLWQNRDNFIQKYGQSEISVDDSRIFQYQAHSMFTEKLSVFLNQHMPTETTTSQHEILTNRNHRDHNYTYAFTNFHRSEWKAMAEDTRSQDTFLDLDKHLPL